MKLWKETCLNLKQNEEREMDKIVAWSAKRKEAICELQQCCTTIIEATVSFSVYFSVGKMEEVVEYGSDVSTTTELLFLQVKNVFILYQNVCLIANIAFITEIYTVGSVIYECKNAGWTQNRQKLLDRVHFSFHKTHKYPNFRSFSITNPNWELQLFIKKLILKKQPQKYLFISRNVRKNI